MKIVPDQIMGMANTLKAFIGLSLAEFHQDGSNRLFSNLLFFCCFFGVGMLAWLLVRGLDVLLGKMAFITVYTLHTALAYTLGRWLIELVVSHIKPSWTGYAVRKVWMQWIIWLLGLNAGQQLHRYVVKNTISYWAQTMDWYRSYPSHTKPLDLYFALGAISVWAISSGLVFLWVLHRQRILIGQAQAALAAPGRAGPAQTAPALPPGGVLRIRSDGLALSIPHAHISHISVEDHYLRIFYGNGGALRNVLIRRPLHKLLKQLPERHFLRIHRSHVVNLGQVAGLEKHGRENRIRLCGHGHPLPISRHRLPALLPRLEKVLAQRSP
jgi:hypothetical protein